MREKIEEIYLGIALAFILIGAACADSKDIRIPIVIMLIGLLMTGLYVIYTRKLR